MIINRNKEKGLTLISMIIAIIVIFVILGTITYSSISSFQMKKLESLYSDLDSIADSVSLFCVKNTTLPVYYSNYNYYGYSQEYAPFSIDNSFNGATSRYYLNFKEGKRDDNHISYGIIDLSKLKDISVNNPNNVPNNIDTGEFGRYHDTDIANLEQAIKDGIYVMNLDTHQVFYTKPVSVKGQKYYTKTASVPSIPGYSNLDNTTVDEKEIGQINPTVRADGYTIRFFASGGDNLSYEIFMSEEEMNSNGINDVARMITFKNPKRPTKTGMKFLGWSLSSGASLADILVVEHNYGMASGYEYLWRTGTPAIRIPQDKPLGSVIELYAVYEIDSEEILYCYYDPGTGGLKPSLSNSVLSRTSNIPAGTKHFLCLDIPTSGYTVSWNWDYSFSDTKEAQYVGNTMTNGIGETTYETTEAGTIKIKGSFTNLTVTVPDGSPTGSKVTLGIVDNNDVYIYNTYNNYTSGMAGNRARKDRAGNRLSSVHWMAGIDGTFEIPDDKISYERMGITDPNNTANYTDDKITGSNAKYYMKKIIVTKQSDIQSNIDIGYLYQGYDFGSIASFPFNLEDAATSGEVCCIYPLFGAKNYFVYSNEDNSYFPEENLADAYSKIYDGYNMVKVLYNIDESPLGIGEQYYQEQHDPRYNDSIYFTANKDFHIDLNGNKLFRNSYFYINDGMYEFGSSRTSGNKGELIFRKGGENSFDLRYNATVMINSGITVTNSSSNPENMVYQNGSSKFFLYNGIMRNLTTNESPAILYSNSTSSFMYIGLAPDDLLPTFYNPDIHIIAFTKKNITDNDITILNNGYAFDSSYSLIAYHTYCYWDKGILKTPNYKYKGSCTEDGEKMCTHTQSYTVKSPCIYKNSEGIYCTYLDHRVWTFSDKDGGSLRTYSTNKLQEAYDIMNIKNDSTVEWVIWLHKDVYDLDHEVNNDSATIKKDMTIKFACNNPTYASSPITFSNCVISISNGAEVDAENMVSDDNGLYFNVSGYSTLNLSNFDAYNNITASNKYFINNSNGTVNVASDVQIRGNRGIRQTNAYGELNIYGKINTTTSNISTDAGAVSFSSGVVNLYNGSSVKSTNDDAIHMTGGTLNATRTTVESTNMNGIYNSMGTINLTRATVKSNCTSSVSTSYNRYGAIYNYYGIANIESSSNVTANQLCGVYSETCNSINIKSSTIKSTKYYSVYCMGNTNSYIYNTTITSTSIPTSSNNKTAAVYNQNGNMYISGSTSIQGKIGMHIAGGGVHIAKSFDTNNNPYNPSYVYSGPSIYGTGSSKTYDSGICITGGNLYLGNNEGSISYYIPAIDGNRYGIYRSGGHIYYYDGYIYGAYSPTRPTDMPETLTGVTIPDGFEMHLDDDGTEITLQVPPPPEEDDDIDDLDAP